MRQRPNVPPRAPATAGHPRTSPPLGTAAPPRAMNTRLISLAVVVLVAGCESSASGPQVSYFNASLDGAIVAEYNGRGTFAFGTRPTGQPTFQISSEELREPVTRTFWVTSWDGGRPAVGTYTLQHVVGPLDDPNARGISAAFLWKADSEDQLFVSDTGTLIVTRSTSKAIEGTFEFVGSRLCAPYVPGCEQGQVGESILQVHGSFRAVPADANLNWNAP